jgi:hypothetical protein
MEGGSTSRSGDRKGELLIGGIVRGLTPEPSSAETGNLAGCLLNPAFSLWLQGYPEEFISCAVRAMRSYRKLRRNSSKRI